MLSIDRIVYNNRLINLAPQIKGSTYLLLLLGMLISPPIVQIFGIVLISGAIIYTSKITVVRYLKWLMIPVPFLLVSFIVILFTFSPDKNDLLLSVKFGSNYWGPSFASLSMGTKLVVRSLACLVCTLFFSVTVPFQQILGLFKLCRVPVFLIEITMLMYRFIFILLEEVNSIYHIQNLRFGHQSFQSRYRSTGLLLQLVMKQSLERYQQMTVALEIKFFNGDFPI